MTNGKTRTLAFQIDEELFQRIKDYLDRESARLGRKFTQKEFVLGLIEEALTEAEAGQEVSPDTALVSPSEAPEEPDEEEDQAEDKGQR